MRSGPTQPGATGRNRSVEKGDREMSIVAICFSLLSVAGLGKRVPPMLRLPEATGSFKFYLRVKRQRRCKHESDSTDPRGGAIRFRKARLGRGACGL